MDRLIYRARIEQGESEPARNSYDLRVLANGHGVIYAYLHDSNCALSYAGVKARAIPASVAEAGGTNEAVARAVRAAMSPRGYRIAYEWTEPEPRAKS